MGKPVDKSPAFQFYPSEYLSSARVAQMTLEEEGAYIRALAFCWLSGSIPSDPEQCARMIGKGGSTNVATVVQAMFVKHKSDDTKLVHERLEKERKKQAEWKKKSSQAGIKSAEVRRGKRKSDVNVGSTNLATLVQPTYEPKSNSLSSSLSSNKKNTRTAKAVANRPSEIPEALWEDFLVLRRAKRSPFTESALKQFYREAARAGITLEQVLNICCARAWVGFNADWLKEKTNQPKLIAAGGSAAWQPFTKED